MKKFILPAVIALSLIIAVVSIGYSSIVVSGIDTEIVQQSETIGELEAHLSELEKAKEEVVDVKVVLNTAAQAGTEVAAYQSKFSNITEETRDGLETMSSSMRNLFGTSDSDATAPWYNGDEEYSWTFETTYSFAGNSVPVVWLCRNKDRDVVAYTTGIYDVKENVFKDIEWKSVSKGAVRTSQDVGLDEDTPRDDIWKALIDRGHANLPDSSAVPTSTPDREMATDIGREDLPADLVRESMEAGIPIPERQPAPYTPEVDDE